jgi:hypothetical protein
MTPEYISSIHEVSARHVDLITRLARELADTPEPSVPGATMLDHTLIMYLGDNGEPHHSSATEFPVLLVGGQGFGMAPGGRTVVYPGIDEPEHRQLSNLWTTVGNLGGVEMDDFGSEGRSRVHERPLPELLI